MKAKSPRKKNISKRLRGTKKIVIQETKPRAIAMNEKRTSTGFF
jgi:hypothetical protein